MTRPAPDDKSREITVEHIRVALCLADPSLEPEILPTLDGGKTIELECESDKELTFVVSPDGDRVYFVAEGKEGFRATGIIRDPENATCWAKWFLS